MLLDKTKEFYTDADRAELEAIRKQRSTAEKQRARALQDGNKEKADTLSKECEVFFWREVEILNSIESRYMASRAGAAEILADVSEIAAAFTTQDYEGYRRRAGSILADQYPETADGAALCLLQFVRVQLNALREDKESQEAVVGIISARALELYPEDGTPETFEKTTKEIETIKYKKFRNLEMNVDKLSTVFFSPNSPKPEKTEIEGQFSFLPVKYEKGGAPEITLFYTYSFNEEKLKEIVLNKEIDDEDYFILSVLDNCYRNGNRIISATKFYEEMTGSNSPNGKDLTKLINRLKRIANTRMCINDKEVRTAWNKNTGDGKYREADLPLAPIAIVAERYEASALVTKGAIKIYDSPELFKLGHDIGQYTTIPKELLYVKKKNGKAASKTARFYRTLHFLIRRIARMKDGGQSNNKILYDTFYNNIGVKRDYDRAKNSLFEILDYFRRCEWINGYKETADGRGVAIYYTKTRQKIEGKDK